LRRDDIGSIRLARNSSHRLPQFGGEIAWRVAGEAQVEQRCQRTYLKRARALGAGAGYGPAERFVRLIYSAEIMKDVAPRPVYLGSSHAHMA
jgi:hypothetical protein